MSYSIYFIFNSLIDFVPSLFALIYTKCSDADR